jgi:hypothetical protein
MAAPIAPADLASALAAVAAALDTPDADADASRACKAAHAMSAALTANPRADPTAVADNYAVNREGLADALSHVADHPVDVSPLVALAAHLHPAGWWWTDPRQILDDELLAALRAEAAPVVTAADAPVLAALCASDAIADAASRAAGRRLVPARSAAYQIDEAFGIHLDREPFPFVFDVIIEHRCPPGTPGARLRVLGPTGDERLAPGVGEGLVLAGRGTLHSWEPLAEGEHRTMITIGLAPG